MRDWRTLYQHAVGVVAALSTSTLIVLAGMAHQTQYRIILGWAAILCMIAGYICYQFSVLTDKLATPPAPRREPHLNRPGDQPS